MNRCIVVLLLTTFSFFDLARSDVYSDSGSPSLRLLNAFFAGSFPDTELKKGRVTWSLSPSLINFATTAENKTKFRDQNLTGFGLSTRALYTLFENEIGNFGLGASLLYFNGHGDGSNVFIGSNNSTGLPGKASAQGEALSLFAIMDLFKKSQDFSLPMFLGVSYISVEDHVLTQTYVDPSSNPSGFSGSIYTKSQSHFKGGCVVAGISPQFNLNEDFRLRGVGIFNFRFSDPNITVESNLGTSTSQTYDLPGEILGAIGAEVTYLPWNLGFSWVPDMITEGASTTSLTYQRNWN